MKTLFESQMDFFSPKPKMEVVDWVEENNLTGMGMDVIKTYQVRLSDRDIEPYIKIEVARMYINSHSGLLHIRMGGIPLIKKVYDYDIDFNVIEHDIAWNEWVDLPPSLVDDMVGTIREK